MLAAALSRARKRAMTASVEMASRASVVSSSSAVTRAASSDDDFVYQPLFEQS